MYIRYYPRLDSEKGIGINLFQTLEKPFLFYLHLPSKMELFCLHGLIVYFLLSILFLDFMYYYSLTIFIKIRQFDFQIWFISICETNVYLYRISKNSKIKEIIY